MINLRYLWTRRRVDFRWLVDRVFLGKCGIISYPDRCQRPVGHEKPHADGRGDWFRAWSKGIPPTREQMEKAKEEVGHPPWKS